MRNNGLQKHNKYRLRKHYNSVRANNIICRECVVPVIYTVVIHKMLIGLHFILAETSQLPYSHNSCVINYVNFFKSMIKIQGQVITILFTS